MSGDCMRFPDTVEEFMDQYKVVDKKGIYMSKGAELVPIFRMNQWFEHEKAQLSQEGTTKGTTTDTISRQAAIDALDCISGVEEVLKSLPSVQPEEAIPVSWIEAKIERFMMADDAFSGLTASIIRAMLNEWKKEQEGDTK